MDINFDTIKSAIRGLSDLIEQFVKVMTDFINSWKEKITIETENGPVDIIM